MKKIVFEFPEDEVNGITIVPIADVHYGNPQFSLTEFENVLAWCKDHNAYLILNGDLIENNIVNSRGGSVFDQTCSIQEQIAYIVDKLKWFAQNKKIINYTCGNHEHDRTVKETGISPAQMIVSLLSQYDETLIDRFCPEGAYNFLKVHYKVYNIRPHSAVFTLYNTHGVGGSTRIGTKTQKLDDLRNVVPAMVYIRSHTHEPEYHTGTYFEIETHNGCDIKEITSHFINTGSFLKYGGYANRKELKPTSRSIPIITLCAKYYNDPIMNTKKRKHITRKEIKVELKNPEEFIYENTKHKL